MLHRHPLDIMNIPECYIGTNIYCRHLLCPLFILHLQQEWDFFFQVCMVQKGDVNCCCSQ